MRQMSNLRCTGRAECLVHFGVINGPHSFTLKPSPLAYPLEDLFERVRRLEGDLLEFAEAVMAWQAPGTDVPLAREEKEGSEHA